MTTGELFKRALAVMAIVLFVVIFWMARDVYVSAFFAASVAVGIGIPARCFECRAMPRCGAMTLSIIVCALGIGLIIALIAPAIVQKTIAVVNDLPAYRTAAAENYNALRASAGFWSRVLPAIQSSAYATTAFSDQIESTSRSWLAGGILMPLLTVVIVLVRGIYSCDALGLKPIAPLATTPGFAAAATHAPDKALTKVST